ncbi:hypothetical protein ES708_21086 [subsurface metagenome]
MKRFASIDFLRGYAIVMMIVLHLIGEILNVPMIMGMLSDGTSTFINLIMLVILPYLGGLAGLFLMVSAVGNMVSMYRQLERGISINQLVLRQIIGGFILLFFGMLSEGTLGLYSTMGNVMRNLGKPTGGNWDQILWGYNTIETIHAIAWCIIYNGITMGILSRGGRWKNTKRLIINYIILAVIVLALTQFVWDFFYNLWGYPWNSGPEGLIRYPVIGVDPWWRHLANIFVAPLATPMEPIFPYLAASYMGSIIGIVIAQDSETWSREHLKKVLYAGFIMFVVGTVGIIIFLVGVMMDTTLPQPNGWESGFDYAIEIYRRISWHRDWAGDNPEWFTFGIVPKFAWLWQFLSLSGFSVMAIAMLIRTVDYRGKGARFAKVTRPLRRFGVIAFTNYTIQWMFLGLHYLMGTILTPENPHALLSWGYTILLCILTLVLNTIIMLLWERINYIGSLEWFIKTLAALLSPARRKAKKGMKWWQWGMIDRKKEFYDVEWINLYTLDEYSKENLKDSKLAYKLALCGLLIPSFSIVNFIAFGISFTAKKNEGSNKYNKRGMILSLIGMILFTAFLAFCFFVQMGTLGIYL